MIKEADIKTFKKNNKQSDVMGVVRTLYPNIKITVTKKK
jgi:hypothetical protein